jgi:hypothetical protein
MFKLNAIWGMFAIIGALPLIGQIATNDLPEYFGKRVKVLASMRLEESTFYIYEPTFKAKGVYSSINEAKSRTPEELVMSVQSETTQEWVNHNWLGGKGQVVSAAQFEKRKTRNKNTNYFELVHKLTFMYNGNKMAIIKYWFVDDGKRTVLANMVLQENAGRWYRTNVAGLDHLSAVVMRVKSEYLAALFKLTRSVRDMPEEKGEATAILSKIRENVLGEQGVLDTERLYNEIIRLRSESRTNELFQLIDKSGVY